MPPYGSMPMMPMFMPPRPGGAGKWITIILLLILLLGSGALNLLLLVGVVVGDGPDHLRQTILKKGNASQQVAVLPLSGLIMDDEAKRFAKLLDRMSEMSAVKAIVVEIDTPGGSVTASDEIYHRLQSFKAARGIPVVISQGALATSGGYYVSCAGDFIFAQPTTLTGNIGVMMPRYNLSKLADKWGIEDTSMHSTGSEFKTAGSLLRPETPKEREYMQGLIDAAFACFREVVEDNRKAVKFKDVATAKVYPAKEAERLHLVDAIGYLDNACAKAEKLAGLTGAQVVRYQPTSSLLDLLTVSSGAGDAHAKDITVNGVNIQLDRRALEALATPRLMYLSTGQ